MRPSTLLLSFVLTATGACAPSPPTRRAAPPPTAAPASRHADEARRSMDVARKLEGEKSCHEAIIAYEQAYRLGRDPAALFGVARCQRASHHPAAAYETFERIAAQHEAQLDPQQRQTVQKAMSELAEVTGGLVVNVSELDADVEVDGKTWGKSPALKHHRAHSGTHTVRVQKPGFATFETEVSLAGGDAKIVEAKLEPEKADKTAAPEMPEAERRAAARAAFQEALALQEKNKCVEAIPKLQTAQRLYEAPTHLLHLAQCLAATGKLLDAQETYETLTRTKLDAGAPDAFVKAKETGRGELAAVKTRVPTLRIQTSPAASSLDGLVVQINGTRMPSDLVGVARPMNPGSYRIEASAGALHATAEVQLRERDARAVDLKLR